MSEAFQYPMQTPTGHAMGLPIEPRQYFVSCRRYFDQLPSQHLTTIQVKAETDDQAREIGKREFALVPMRYDVAPVHEDINVIVVRSKHKKLPFVHT